MTMRVLVTAFFFFLLFSDFYLVMSVEKADVVPCCSNFVAHRIPKSLVIAFVRTSPQCPKPGVLFETKQGLKVCANPAIKWVQKYIKHLS
ncbi:C-C motif chemokine 18-like [Macrotis lagotis]|uniref:C-C motif chemokine 18-like n=1 Tax=Macrotis lagotis TaxID=92651 RepID=UPI003D6956E3